jgi:hypothetical protein
MGRDFGCWDFESSPLMFRLIFPPSSSSQVPFPQFDFRYILWHLNFKQDLLDSEDCSNYWDAFEKSLEIFFVVIPIALLLKVKLRCQLLDLCSTGWVGGLFESKQLSEVQLSWCQISSKSLSWLWWCSLFSVWCLHGGLVLALIFPSESVENAQFRFGTFGSA